MGNWPVCSGVMILQSFMHIVVLTYRLHKYGQSFMHNNFESDLVDVDQVSQRPEMELWDRTTIWAKFPEMSYKEMMESDNGLMQWLDLFYRVTYIIYFFLYPCYKFVSLK